jgi:hypothetical protein
METSHSNNDKIQQILQMVNLLDLYNHFTQDNII